MTIKIWDGKSYHITSAQINADKEGCEVFEINGQMGQLRVLAHDRTEACEAYREEMTNDPEYCGDCGRYGFLNCVCDEIECLEKEIESLKKPPTAAECSPAVRVKSEGPGEQQLPELLCSTGLGTAARSRSTK